MVSVTELLKANELSKELKKHGFASDYQDAYKQAVTFYDKDQVSPELKFVDKEQAVVEPVLITNTALDELKQRMGQLERYNDFGQKNQQEFKREVTKLHEKFDEITRALKLVELNQMNFQKQMETLRVPEPQQVSGVQSQASNIQPPTLPIAQAAASQPVNPAAEAAGFSSEDVSVERIFYSGSN